MIACPECTTEVSDAAKDCPSCGVQLRKPTRSFMGKIIKWLFIAFNLLMILWVWSAGSLTGEMEGASAVGGVIGTGLIIGLWAIGDVIIGLLVLLTRPK
jgi:small-conductance mechanosensitive channel